MPALTGGGGSSTTVIGSDSPVMIGAVVLDFGPYRVQIVRQPRVALQQGVSSIFRWDYGWQPTTYILEGYSASNAVALGYDLQADVAVAHQIVDQFEDGVTPVQLLIPTMGVQDSIVLTAAQLSEDATVAPLEPVYRLEFASATVQQS